jgi:hypothetical protein
MGVLLPAALVLTIAVVFEFLSQKTEQVACNPDITVKEMALIKKIEAKPLTTDISKDLVKSSLTAAILDREALASAGRVFDKMAWSLAFLSVWIAIGGYIAIKGNK